MPGGSSPPEFPVVHLDGPGAWEKWLADNHASSPGVWLQLAKKGLDPPGLTHPQALEIAICFGWIDAQRRALDANYFRQRFTPRAVRSRWSQINREKAEQLLAAGRMRASGIAQVTVARADGRWEQAYAPQSRATVPADFQQALDAAPPAQAFFSTLTGSRRYAFLYRLHNVRSPERRAQRIADYIERLSDGRTLD